MPETIVVITDTSCLIALLKVKVLHLLPKIYTKIIITEEIASEFGEPIPSFITIEKGSNKKSLQILNTFLDKGEASAIALALDLENVILILDDLKARKEAQRLGLKMTGTLGVLFKLKQTNLIPLLKPVLERLKKQGFRISEKIELELLSKAGE